jgi:hypothetical protein
LSRIGTGGDDEAKQANDTCDDDGNKWPATVVNVTENLRGLSTVGQGSHGTRCSINRRVSDAQDGNENDNLYVVLGKLEFMESLTLLTFMILGTTLMPAFFTAMTNGEALASELLLPLRRWGSL